MLREIYQNFRAGQLFGKSKALLFNSPANSKLRKDKEVRALEREVLEALRRLKERISQCQ